MILRPLHTVNRTKESARRNKPPGSKKNKPILPNLRKRICCAYEAAWLPGSLGRLDQGLANYTQIHTYCPWLLPHYNGRGESFQKRLYIPQSLKYLLSEKNMPTSGLDNQAQEPSQLRQRGPSNRHRCLSMGRCSCCPNASSSVPKSWQCQREIQGPRQTHVIGGVQVTCPHISCKGSWKPDRQTSSASCMTQSRQGPSPARGFGQRTAKHTGRNWYV